MSDIYTFNFFEPSAAVGVSQALSAVCKNSLPPVFVCVGSDLVLGDSLGPLCGTLIKNSFAKTLNSPFCYVYGTLNMPVTAKEVNYVKNYIKKTHPSSPVLVIDAAVGKIDDVGLIRVIGGGIKPGLGVNKNLSEIGDVSIIGIVAEKSQQNFGLFRGTRLNLIYKMADIITRGVALYLDFKNGQEKSFVLTNSVKMV